MCSLANGISPCIKLTNVKTLKYTGKGYYATNTYSKKFDNFISVFQNLKLTLCVSIWNNVHTVNNVTKLIWLWCGKQAKASSEMEKEMVVSPDALCKTDILWLKRLFKVVEVQLLFALFFIGWFDNFLFL